MDLTPYDRILSAYEPYLVARPPVLEAIDRAPLGIRIPGQNLFDPQHTEGRDFVSLVKKLDALTFGPMGLTMPDWVFYDCAVMPGAVFGFAQPVEEIDPWVRRVLDVPEDHQGLVPVSIFIAIPMAHREATLVYTLCSINQASPGSAPEGMWRLTLAAGTAALGRDEIVGTVQWRSPRLGLFSGLGPLELLSAWTPAHDNPTTCTFRCVADGLRYLRPNRFVVRSLDQLPAGKMNCHASSYPASGSFRDRAPGSAAHPPPLRRSDACMHSTVSICSRIAGTRRPGKSTHRSFAPFPSRTAICPRSKSTSLMRS